MMDECVSNTAWLTVLHNVVRMFGSLQTLSQRKVVVLCMKKRRVSTLLNVDLAMFLLSR